MNVLRLSLFSVVLLAAAACVSAPSAGAPSTAPNAVTASPGASPSPVVASSLIGSGPNAGATPALPAATVSVSPAEVQAGALTLSLSLERARHMLDQSTATTTDPDPAHQAGTGTGGAADSTAFVLQGLLQLTNNFNPAQQIPDDQPQLMLRHVNVQIRSSGAAATDSVPYLAPSMDVLLDGHPVIANVPLLPMVDAEAAPPQLYYGNNVKLTQRGAYQVFVRILPNALLGKDPVPAAEFSVTLH